ncbi:DUF6082 family protein [Yinghuangia soli]|uniref:DUF6082 family protein n=1 Tax=Yinghuangia soli TaxID=2908204 RepID=A0AA41U0G2_9ACTN|nr:DUF6082 family protein [Yinghuangia soli]MCF2526397.1 DUF6082 family protein [Yinghuangia soli]
MVALSFGLSLATTELAGGNSGSLRDRATVGQSFDAVSAVFSGLALLAVAVTGYVQQRELQNHRRYAKQNADAAVQSNHLELLKLSLQDPELASVWPAFAGRVNRGLERKYLYANMIITHLRYTFASGEATESEVRAELAYLFSSQLIYEYWDVARPVRATLPADALQHPFYALAEEEWQRARR